MLRPIGYRPATDNDIDFLYALHVATMKEYVDKTWGWDDTFQKAVFRKNYVPAEIQIIILEGKDVGMLTIEERDDEVFLRTIEIHPEYQGKGIATTIIGKLVTESAQKMKPVRLRVLKVNRAKRLYDRLGFLVIEESPTHYIMLTSISESK